MAAIADGAMPASSISSGSVPCARAACNSSLTVDDGFFDAGDDDDVDVVDGNEPIVLVAVGC